MWRLGFFFHEMGYGLLSIFLPLYIMSIAPANGLFYIGIIFSLALFMSIPASFMWGYLCDKTRRYKRYILLSFLSSAILLYLFTYSANVVMLIILYTVMSMLHMAHEPPKNVLISEIYSHEDWEKNFAFYEGFTEVGWLIGLLLGFIVSTYGFGSALTLFICSGLNLVAFVLSAVFVTDPTLVFERGLVRIERTVDFASHGVFLASSMMEGIRVSPNLKRENVTIFCGALVLFSLATNILFTPMPVFMQKTLANASFPASMVFAVYVLNSGGGVLGYSIARSRAGQSTGKGSLTKVALFRSLLALLLIVGFQLSAPTTVGLATTILFLMGLLYALFIVATEILSMELIPARRAGLFNVLIGIGAAIGSFVGPFIAQNLGFSTVFVTAGAIFLFAYVTFKIF
jgi:MFS family permease